MKSNADIWIKNKRGDYPIHEAITLYKFRNQNNEHSELQTGCLGIRNFVLFYIIY
jgi:hypothetical protein